MSENEMMVKAIAHEKVEKMKVEGGYEVDIFPSVENIVNSLLKKFLVALKMLTPDYINYSLSEAGIVGVEALTPYYWIDVNVEKVVVIHDIKMSRHDVHQMKSLIFNPLLSKDGETALYYIQSSCLSDLSEAAREFMDEYSLSNFVVNNDMYVIFDCHPPRQLNSATEYNCVTDIKIQNILILEGVGDIACNFDYHVRSDSFISQTPGALMGGWELVLGGDVIDANLPLVEALKKLLAAKKEA